jgi:hypothetical protein
LPVGLLFFIAISLGLASPWPDNQDGVNFLLGLKHYDITAHQPHFPGYPAYIATGKLLDHFVTSPEWTLISLSIFSGVICIGLMVKMVEKDYGRITGLICGGTLAVNTIFFEFSHKIFSEIPALAVLLFAAYVLGNTQKKNPSLRWFIGGAALGLLLGLRLSWWPFPLFFLIYGLISGARWNITTGIFLGVIVWLIPQIALTGAAEFFSVGWSFTLGHFTGWGAGAGFTIVEKIILFSERIAEAMGWVGTGEVLTKIPWMLFSIYGLLLSSYRIILKEQKYNIFISATLFYLLWVAMGQNPENVRHLIPIIPAALLIIAPVISQFPKTATIATAVFALTLPIDYANRLYATPPAVRFLLWSDSNQQPPGTVYYCGESERFFDLYRTGAQVVNVKRAVDLDNAVKATWPTPENIMVCNDIAGLKPTGKPHREFPARRGDPVDHTLRLDVMDESP